MMKKSSITLGVLLLLTAALAIPLSGCRAGPTPTVVYSQYQLEYRLISYFGKVFYCDPDYYPVPREGEEQKNALEQFPAIRANQAEFSAILEHSGLPNKAEYTDAEKLTIYRAHKDLFYGVQMTASEDIYNYTLSIGEEGQGERIEGTITLYGEIKVLNREPSFNTCPICLSKGTLIDTPYGPVPVEQLRQGMAVWTADGSGKRVAAQVVEITQTPVPASFQMVKITLDDGRTVTASAGHPTAEGRALGTYLVGDTLDGALVASAEFVAYGSGMTYDILPSGTTGLYWANGVLLKSTLSQP